MEPDPKVLESLQKQEKSQAQLAGHIDGKGPHESWGKGHNLVNHLAWVPLNRTQG